LASSLASTIKISYEMSNLMNLKKGIKFAKNYDFKMAPFLIRLYQKRGHLKCAGHGTNLSGESPVGSSSH
jgi:hypothetical protein